MTDETTKNNPFRFMSSDEVAVLSLDERITYIQRAIEELRQQALLATRPSILPAEKAPEKGN